MAEMEMIEAPLALYTAVVLPEWLDYNQHMTEGFYGVVFGNASDAFIDYMGMGAAYRERTQGTIYTVEAHTTFLREVKGGSPLRFTTQLLGFDAKRMQVFHQMFQADEGFLAATFETMMLHVNQATMRVTPFPPEILANFEAVYAVHGRGERPLQVGRAIKQL
ncbi:MAG: thioesterase family protein [Ardenticatenaceae bacterium]|nr:thioesterase family protein [Ardenticatenaceae bacterium]